MPTCAVPGCRSRRTTYSKHCETHKAHTRRHGDPQQRTITEKQLAPYRKLVRAVIRRNKLNGLWEQLDSEWANLIQYCHDEVREFMSGRPKIGHAMYAYDQLLKLTTDVKPRLGVETVLAMYLMLELEPRQFRSDDGFRFQLVRRVRGLSETSVGSYYNYETRKVHRVYRDPPPRATNAMADVLVQIFGRSGLYIARLERHRIDTQGQQKKALDKALSELV